MYLKTIRTSALFVAVIALGACSSTPTNTPAAPAAPAAAAVAPPTSGNAAANTGAAASAQPAAAALPPHRDPASALSRDRVVYFAYDSDALDAAGRAIVERHARYLTTNPTLSIRVEGHADERGSSEYNLALGQRRAEAVRRALALLGVADARVEATSWGEERPQDPAHDEAAWQRNRRGEIVYSQR
ncbi:MAG: peptidoglycan-associated lipoprotein Pal [Aquincola sp.]|nr:peptidoglycan-associated lipoprotein Pal [Aquincola sp.]MDH5330531.1 peptidoglycan-associated lipoprotein Pal [Aquincola sp.]